MKYMMCLLFLVFIVVQRGHQVVAVETKGQLLTILLTSNTAKQQLRLLHSVLPKSKGLHNYSHKNKVAFLASLTGGKQYGHFSKDSTVKYDVVWTNIGNAYSKGTGVFTVPYSGLYNLEMHAKSPGKWQFATLLSLMINGVEKITAFGQKDGSLGNSGLFVLKKGDRVWVKLRKGRAMDAQGSHNTFSGFLIN